MLWLAEAVDEAHIDSLLLHWLIADEVSQGMKSM
jgi:hypothetical protein